ncbi:hypothetical protein GCK72_012940 [Caenorhabditis remanei]|uniref:E3 ubiquitin-protein ligase n=1 Tax=Caenorhabditis remanei TaxID=31234 RepID=A0A6A5GMG3_CAERE|nr:hypothetical protein GCK72_012940 [Caenorhabditis remanei]KAF1756487.1 hypothetical protein GCK72_012940 [Caenorhabditis remanei]
MIVDLVQSVLQGEWAQVRQLLFKHWLVQVPQVFEINEDIPWDNTGVKEKLLGPSGQLLFSPIVSAFLLDVRNTKSDLGGMNEIAGVDPSKTGKICGHVFKNVEETYTCLDCATDKTCVMCLPCFKVSIHKSHKYEMRSSSGSGCCDCGDVEAWLEGYACANHKKKDDDETFTLAPELKKRSEQLIEIILHFALSMLTHNDDLKLPDFFEKLEIESSTDNQQCLTVLYKNETHSYESVLKVLELYCTKDQAMFVETIVDREGRSAVKLGNKTDCTRAKDDHHLPLSFKKKFLQKVVLEDSKDDGGVRNEIDANEGAEVFNSVTTIVEQQESTIENSSFTMLENILLQDTQI